MATGELDAIEDASWVPGEWRLMAVIPICVKTPKGIEEIEKDRKSNGTIESI
jgi:hypothetical protein